MAPRRQLGIVARWFPLIILITVLTSVATYLVVSRQEPVSQVSATLLPAQLRLAGDPDYDTVSVSRLVGMSTNYALAAKGHDLLTKVVAQLNLTQSAQELSRRVDASVDPNAVLTITARAGDAAGAAALANAVAREIEAESAVVPSNQAVPAELATIRQRILETEAEYERLLALPAPRTNEDSLALANSLTLLHELTTLYDSLSASTNKTPGGLIVIDAADPRAALAIAPRTLYYSLLAAVAGLLLAAGIAAVLEYLDDRVRDPDGVRAAAGLPTLGAIRRKGRLVRGGEKLTLATLHNPRSRAADAYRALRATIELASLDRQIRTILVTSSVPSQGKSATAANLAVAFAQAGRRVMLVDADLRRPGIHRLFRLPNAEGLSTLLHDHAREIDAVAQAVEQKQMRVLTAGPTPLDPAADLGSDAFRDLVGRLLGGCDLVVFDSPSLQVAVDAAVLSSSLDGTLLVIDASRGSRAAVTDAGEALVRAHANVLGAVLYNASQGTFPDYQGDSKAQPRTEGVAAPAVEPVKSV